LTFQLGQFDGAGIQAGAGQLHEVTAPGQAVEGEFGAAQINDPFAGLGEDVPSAAGVEGEGGVRGRRR
jgi:hypothetical protein